MAKHAAKVITYKRFNVSKFNYLCNDLLAFTVYIFSSKHYYTLSFISQVNAYCGSIGSYMNVWVNAIHFMLYMLIAHWLYNSCRISVFEKLEIVQIEGENSFNIATRKRFSLIYQTHSFINSSLHFLRNASFY